MTPTKAITITDIFLAKGLIDALFLGRVPKDLYRFASANSPHRPDSPWEPVWYPYSRLDTKSRRNADIEVKWEAGAEWVTPAFRSSMHL